MEHQHSRTDLPQPRDRSRESLRKTASPSTDSKWSTTYQFSYRKTLNQKDESRANQEMGRKPARNGRSPYSRVVRKQQKEEKDCCHRLIRFYSDESEIGIPGTTLLG